VTDARTLGEIAARAAMLNVACTRCERRGRYRLDTLISRYGADAGVRVIVPELTADCPQRESVALMEAVRHPVRGATSCFPNCERIPAS
jgi:hypothetical protein